MDFEAVFKEFIHKNNFLKEHERALLAVSGGVDSVVMAHLFRAAGLPFGVAHCNFQLRGAESDGDEAFVRDTAAAWGVPFFVKRFDTEAYAAGNGLSIQMAARDLRYAWFEELRVANGYACIATAHNLDDSVETALFNFARGTGLSGLNGIALRNGFVVRPLLFATRAEITAYAQNGQLAWREDSSNTTDDYARNYIRHHIVPRFAELNPDFLHTAARNMRRVGEAAANLRYLLGDFPEKTTGGLVSFDKKKLFGLPAPADALRHLLKPYSFTEEQVRQLAENPGHTGLELYSEKGYRLVNDRDAILIAPPKKEGVAAQPAPLRINADDLMLSLSDGSRLILMATTPTPPSPDGRETIIVDAEKLQFPLLLRPWQEGDVFQPLGLGSRHQKLQDFFTNMKLSRIEKDRTLLLVNADNAIIWVLGYRPDERFKITEYTSNALKITILKK